MKKSCLLLCLALCLVLASCARPLREEETTTTTRLFQTTERHAANTTKTPPKTSGEKHTSTGGTKNSAKDTQGGTSTTKQPSTAPTETGATANPATGTVRVVIPEGFSFMQIAKRLEANNICSAEDFYNVSQNYQVKSFTVPDDPNRCFKMEGYLFPATYEFHTGSGAEDVLRTMLNAYAAQTGLPDNDTLILASVIQREARSVENMKLVSSVFHNRIKQGWGLQSDPTREYVNIYITGNPLVANQEKYAPLYNTYRDTLQGKLPAGPICSPGLAALNAAKHPAQSDYMFFYFGVDNQNHYSKTLEEHEQKMREIPVQFGN